MPQSEAAAPLSLRQFTALLSRHINLTPELQGRWVVAELSDFRYHGPHAYGQLIEKDASGRTVAKMQATIWGNVLQNIMAKFRQTTGQNITTGMKVMLRLTATHSELYGLSANVSDIDPSYTLGDMERLRREILDTLRREGVYDANKSVPLPDAPQRIAVISAAGPQVTEISPTNSPPPGMPSIPSFSRQICRVTVPFRQSCTRLTL